VTAEESDKRRRLDALRAMHDRGNASNVELLRSQAQHEVAAGRLKTAQEQLALRDLERKRIAVQIDRRTLRSPMDGQVLQQLKQPGEFVSSTDAKVLCLVQLDVLQARFALPTSDLHAVRAGRTVDLLIGQQQLPARGIVEFVSPVVDAETGTVLVKVRIENAEGKYVSGSVVSFAATANRVTTKRQAISRDSATGGRQRTPSRNTVSQR
ncbi:MAG: HlyD family efflux transporter periplasmic adaptor subunit, partial [Planctomycetota bacterium]